MTALGGHRGAQLIPRRAGGAHANAPRSAQDASKTPGDGPKMRKRRSQEIVGGLTDVKRYNSVTVLAQVTFLLGVDRPEDNV